MISQLTRHHNVRISTCCLTADHSCKKPTWLAWERTKIHGHLPVSACDEKPRTCQSLWWHFTIKPSSPCQLFFTKPCPFYERDEVVSSTHFSVSPWGALVPCCWQANLSSAQFCDPQPGSAPQGTSLGMTSLTVIQPKKGISPGYRATLLLFAQPPFCFVLFSLLALCSAKHKLGSDWRFINTLNVLFMHVHLLVRDAKSHFE